MKSLSNSSFFRLHSHFIDTTGVASVGVISMDSTTNLGGQFFFQSKAEGFRILEK
jgi:hypothetical protein